jgi:hypothetical protein
MNRRRVIVGIVLVLWACLGPIGMAFNGCALMGAICGAPCALTSCIMPSVSIQVSLPVTFVEGERFLHPPTALVKVPTPPPRLLSIFA